MISKSFGLSLFPFQCLAKMSGACCLSLPRSCVGLTSQTCLLSKPRSVSKHTIKNYVVAQKVTMKTAGDNITLKEIMYSAGMQSSSIATEHYFSRHYNWTSVKAVISFLWKMLHFWKRLPLHCFPIMHFQIPNSLI